MLLSYLFVSSVLDFALFHGPAPPPPVSAALRLPTLCLPETCLQDCLAASLSWQTRCIGLSRSGSASPQKPSSRPPHFPRHSWPSGRCRVRSGIQRSLPAAQGILLLYTVRCAVDVRVFFLAAAAAAGVCISLRRSSSRARFYTDMEAGMAP